MTSSFTYDQPQQRIVFAPGSVNTIAAELAALGMSRALLVASSRRAGSDAARASLGGALCAVWTEVRPHVPVQDVQAAEARARAADADAIVAVGGGSAIGLAKAVARSIALPIVAVPTTYAGSEMTPIYGTSQGTTKTTGRDERVRPRTVIYDPELTIGLPSYVTAGSGLNAIAHCVEGLYAQAPGPVTEAVAGGGLARLVAGLPTAVTLGDDLAARSLCLAGAYLAGQAISAGVALHHKLCHAIGGNSRAAHGDINAVILAHVIAFNASATPAAMSHIATVLEADDPASAVYDFAQSLGAPTSLAALGIRQEALPAIAEATIASPFYNPRRVTLDDVLTLLTSAYRGERPSVEMAWSQ